MKEKIERQLEELADKIRKMALTRFLIMGYVIVILVGTLLLALPIAGRNGAADLNEALFTATSATCVTGLVLSDVYTQWSLFGQIVILMLIQIGGVGFMTIAIFALSFTKHRIGLKQRFTMQESVGAHQVGGIVRMTKFLLLASVGIELAGAFVLCFRFCPKLGFFRGVYFSVFHAVSAFCNAGIDLMGYFEPGSSVMTVKSDVVINLVFMILIIVGGLGFLVWHDMLENKWRFKYYKLQTKIVIVTSLSLLIFGAVSLFIFEYSAPCFDGLSVPEKILASFFQSTSARTAGFASVDLSQMNEAGQFVMIFLMFIGGSSGSTAGGIKTTTFAVLIISIYSVFRRRKTLECFRRRLDEEVVHNACCILMLYLMLAGAAAVIISFVEGVSMMAALFECVSAIATVGLSLGLTSSLGIVSQLIIVFLMFVGRIGGLTVLLALSGGASSNSSQYPCERITVG